MNRYVVAALSALGLALGGWALWQRADAASARADAAEQQLEQATQRERQKDAVIDTLRTTAANLEAQRRAAAEQQAALERTASDRLSRIEKLQNENDKLRDWASTRLPDAVIRMRERAAVTGAAAYRQSMRDAESLHPAGEPSDQ